MESAPKFSWRRRLNEMADNGTLLPNLLLTLVLFALPAVAWLVLGTPPDLVGWVALIAYGFVAGVIFKGLVRGDWHPRG